MLKRIKCRLFGHRWSPWEGIGYHLEWVNWCLFTDIPCYLKPTDECKNCIQFWTLPHRQKEAIEAFLVSLKVILEE